MNVTVREGKGDEKNEAICLVYMVLSSVMVSKLSKKGHLFQFCDDLSQTLRSVKAVYIYGFESSHFTISQNNMV